MGDGGVLCTPCADFSRPVEELEYTCLLKSTFTCHMDPNNSKVTTGKERVITVCAESQSTSRDPNRTRFLEVQVTIRDEIQCDNKSSFPEVDTSLKKNLMLVGGHGDNTVDLCGEDNTDTKSQFLGKGHRTVVSCFPVIRVPI
jgi:hypothetical protein